MKVKVAEEGQSMDDAAHARGIECICFARQILHQLPALGLGEGDVNAAGDAAAATSVQLQKLQSATPGLE